MSNTREWKVSVRNESTTAVFDAPTSPLGIFICAHGAGGNIADRGTLAAAKAMQAAGLGVVRFNFLYKERKTGRPDPMPQLMACYAAVADRARAELKPSKLFLGGRSMGGRTASMLAADGFATDGLIMLAYPLHPPGSC